MPKLAQKILIIASIIATLGGTLTFLMTWRSIGFSDTFVTSWLSSFALCVLCIAPLGGVISYALNRTINAVLPNFSSLQKNITFGFGMAFIMEAIMGAVTTMNLHGYESSVFASQWSAAFLAALPVGIVFSIVMSLVIKPRLETFLAS
ncbi:DUF2798 domain-containing protein [Leucothrix mucor]|jgi:hypothetical protein|uniref:DUF2798 domain-containing protein n=1 Tax=Leucothrix mucor TaxID=45248 RepID=UPI0003B388E3|nr:DUF2798 domain-containing protein [Leucothrix mucor]